jgi:hypothetical protein
MRATASFGAPARQASVAFEVEPSAKRFALVRTSSTYHSAWLQGHSPPAQVVVEG